MALPSSQVLGDQVSPAEAAAFSPCSFDAGSTLQCA